MLLQAKYHCNKHAFCWVCSDKNDRLLHVVFPSDFEKKITTGARIIVACQESKLSSEADIYALNPEFIEKMQITVIQHTEQSSCVTCDTPMGNKQVTFKGLVPKIGEIYEVDGLDTFRVTAINPQRVYTDAEKAAYNAALSHMAELWRKYPWSDKEDFLALLEAQRKK